MNSILITKIITAFCRYIKNKPGALVRRSVRAIKLINNRFNPTVIYLTNDTLDSIVEYHNRRKLCVQKIAVYTAIIGKYDTLLIPEVLNPEIDYICYTDQNISGLGVWQFRKPPFYHTDATRISRFIKTHPNMLLDRYDYAVWVDANIFIKTNFSTDLDRLKASNATLGFIKHPHRDNIYDEALACIAYKKDSIRLIREQINIYRNDDKFAVHELIESNYFIAKLNARGVERFFREWWREIYNYSKRDQISLPYVLAKNSNINYVHLLDGNSVRTHADFQLLEHARTNRLMYSKDSLLKIHSMNISYDDKGETDGVENVKNRSIDVVICVHNALEVVKECIDSVLNNCEHLHRIIIINDHSDKQTTMCLRETSRNGIIKLIENKNNLGYVRSANIGLRVSNADLVVLLNSDTVVPYGWIERIARTAFSSEHIGIVGPLSNAAGYQSVPSIKWSSNNTPINKIPDRLSIENINTFLSKISGEHATPIVPMIHGFCIAIKRQVIEKIGYFDELMFKKFYGEENDYCLRCNMAGMLCAVATDTYIHHHKSQSINEVMRINNMDKGAKALHLLYSNERIRKYTLEMKNHPTLKYIRSSLTDVFRENSKGDGAKKTIW